MIQSIKLKNFKCFEALSLEMSNLNVFTGINNMGKSTAIQSLLLLRQSFEMGAIDAGLYLNGNITRIGTGYDLLYRNSEKDEIEINLESNNCNYYWKYGYSRDSDFQKLKETNISQELTDKINIFNPYFSYVSAERIGPQRFYSKSYHEVVNKNQVGYKGDFYADYLSVRGQIDKVENINVNHPKANSQLLLYQTQAWISEISPGIKLNIKDYTEAGLVGMEYVISDNRSANSFNPLNVGFGLSYVIPIVVALLKAKNGDLVILENPEAHLHPKGQRKMGELISKACAGGIQVVLETHSDHLLNGIRLAVKKNLINRSKIRLNFFYQTIEEKIFVHKKCSPAILDDGSLSDWPDGFFDEWEKAIDELL
jgi:predicted ATPase